MIKNINKKTLVKIFKTSFALVSAGIVLLTPMSCTKAEEMPKQFRELGIVKDENSRLGSIGEESRKDNFSLAYCGNHATNINSDAIKMLKNTKVPTGVVITPTSTTLADIYMDVDYVKDIISKYRVEYPVCLDIDTMCSISDNSQGDIDVMVSEFVQKLCANGCKVIVIGNQENIDNLSDKDNYEVGIILSEEQTDLEKMYPLLVSGTYVYSTKDYETEIESNNQNTTSKFVEDYVHTVVEGETLTSIANLYGLSVNNLKLTNFLSSDSIHPGQLLVIKSKYDLDLIVDEPSVSNETLVENEVDTSKYYKGIDVSEFQGRIDWEVARQKIDFAILRIADASNKDNNGNIMLDSYFKYNISECNRLGIPVGVYIYTRADNEAELNEEVRFILKEVKPYNITLPIYRDLEGSRAEELRGSEQSRLLQVNLTDSFCAKIESAGYPSGVYLHKKYLSYIPELGDKYSIWAQGGWYYSTECDYDDMLYAMETPTEQFKLTYTVNIFQPTECGLASELGIYDNRYVDFDYVSQEFVDSLIDKFDKKGNVYVLKRD